ncbi:MAG: type II toxin-antitoxin system RelE family toxin [Candidatus Natronoplasma sp.]
MKFEVLILPDLLKYIPPDRTDQIRKSLRKLKNPYPGKKGGDRKKIKGTDDVVYRFGMGDHRAFYRIDKENSKVYVFDILRSEQAHKKYGRL